MCEQEVRFVEFLIESSLLNLAIYGWVARPVSEARVHRNFDQILKTSVGQQRVAHIHSEASLLRHKYWN